MRYAFGVTFPDVKVCNNHSTPWRAFCNAYFANSPMSVWVGSRGFGGKTFMLATLGVTIATTKKVDVSILGGSGEQSRRVHEHMRTLWSYDNAPRHLLDSENQFGSKMIWGNKITALMASETSVRGGHPVVLLMDEIDVLKLSILDSALGQTMSKSGVKTHTVMSSTHQNANGTMTEILHRANDRGWPVYSWCWQETSAQPDGWLEKEEVERKRSEITESMWKTEYDLQEPSPESRAINTEAVEKMFLPIMGEYEGYNGEYIEIEEPEPGAKYATGADWARKVDHMVIATLRIDTEPIRLVAFERAQRLPWPQMVAKFDERIKRFPGSACHDGTGVGDVVDGYITEAAEGVIMVGRARSDLLGSYVGAIERGEIICPYIKWLYNEHKLASIDDLYGSGHLPDSIAAGSLAYRAATVGRTNTSVYVIGQGVVA